MNINNNIQLHPLEPGKRERAFWSSNGPPHNFLMMMSGMCWSNVMWRTMVSGGNAQSIRIHIKVTTRTWFGCVFIHNAIGNFLKTWESHLVIQSKPLFVTKTPYFLDFSRLLLNPIFLYAYSIIRFSQI